MTRRAREGLLPRPELPLRAPAERPLRIHHQFGIEAFRRRRAEQDVECMLLQLDFYRRCGLRDLAMRINSLGDRESKQRYREALVAYFEPSKDALSDDSQRRLGENPMASSTARTRATSSCRRTRRLPARR
jgi:histidyl-tRNA synthetase